MHTLARKEHTGRSVLARGQAYAARHRRGLRRTEPVIVPSPSEGQRPIAPAGTVSVTVPLRQLDRAGLRTRAGLLRPVIGVLRDPMLRNGHALILSAGVTQVIGAVYWVAAARMYPASVVGRNSVALSVMQFLAAVAELNLMSTLVRFLPTSGRRSVRLILAVYAASATIAAITGAAFLFLIPLVEPQLAFLRSNPFLMLWFVVSVITGAIFVLQDSALTGVRAAPFVPVENATFSIFKLGIMFPLARLLPATGIFVSWTVAIAASIVPTNAYLFGCAIPRHLRRQAAGNSPSAFKDIRSYVVPDSLAGLFTLACTYLLPLLIIDRLGPAAAGHYALAWIIGYALYSVSLNMGSSLVVETAADRSILRERCFRSIFHLAKITAPVVALIVVLAPYALLVFGRGYAAADVTLLRLLALSALPTIITNTAISVTRSQRRMRAVVGIQVCLFALVWGISIRVMRPLGITGIGLAWLVAETSVSAVLVSWPRLWLPPRPAARHASAG